MKNTAIQIKFDTDKVDALRFYSGKKGVDIDAEMTDALQKLYEKFVDKSTREYIESKATEQSVPTKKSASRRLEADGE